MPGPFSTNHQSSSSFGSSFGLKSRVVDAAYTVDPATDHILLVDTSSAAITVTLPAAASCHNGTSGLVLRVVCLSVSDDVTVDGAGSETIDGATTAVITGAYAGQTFFCDGAEWYTLS